MLSRRARFGVPALLCTALAVFLGIWLGSPLFGTAVVADPTLTQDTYLLMTLYEVWGDRVASGSLPTWTPEYDVGYPTASAWMYGLKYPGAVLFAVLPVESAWAWTFLLHAVFGGLGAYLWTREERGGLAGPLAAGVVFATAEFLVGRFLAGHQNLVWPVVWVPWIAWSMARVVRGARFGTLTLVLTAACGLLAGHVQVWFYLAPVLAISGMLRAGRDAAAWGRLALAAVGTLGLTAVQWLPTWELRSLVGEPPARIDHVYLASSATWFDLIGRVVPDLGGASLAPSAERSTFLHEVVGVAGLPIFAMVVPALLRGGRARWFWVVTLLVGGALALGATTGISSTLNDLPLLSWMRAPARALVLWLPALTFLVGAAVGDRCDDEATSTGTLWVGLAAGAVVGILLHVQALRAGATEGWEPVLLGVAGIALLGAALWATGLGDDGDERAGARRFVWAPALALLVLAVAGIPSVATIPSEAYRQDWSTTLPGGALDHRIHVEGGPMPNVERLGGRSLRRLSHARAPWHEELRSKATAERAYWMDLATEIAPLDPSRVRAGRAVATDQSVRGFGAMGAGRVFDGALAGDDATALAAVDDRRQVLYLVDDGPTQQVSEPIPGASVRRVSGRLDADRAEYEVDTPLAGWAIVSELWYPGWTAEVDGREVIVRRANAAFRAVEVPAGKSRIVFRYEAPGLRAGSWLSGLTLLVLVAGTVAGLRRRPRPAAPTDPDAA